MKRMLGRLAAVAVAAAQIGLVTLAAVPASAASSAQERREIQRQQQVILDQQKQILENQRRIDSQRAQLTERSPVTGEPVDQSKLPKGLLSGILPSCPLGFAYNPFVGCVLYVAH